MKPELLTAWALKQLKPEEQLRLEQELRGMPAERQQASATRAFSQLLSHRLQDDSMTLTESQRQRLIQTVKMSPPSSPAPFAPLPLRWWQRPAIPLLAAAAAVILVAATVWHHLETRPEVVNEVPPHLERLRVSPPLIVSETASPPILHTGIPSRLNEGVGQGDPARPQRTLPTVSSLTAPLSSMPDMKPITRQISVSLPSPSEDATSHPFAKHPPSQNSGQGAVSPNGGEFVSVSRHPHSSLVIQASTTSSAEVINSLKVPLWRTKTDITLSDVIRAFPSDGQGPPPGSKHPFSVHAEMAPCPWDPRHHLARIHLQGRDAGTSEKPLQLVFLIDVSSSMRAANKLPLVKRSLHRLLQQLGDEDQVSMLTSGSGTNVHLSSTKGSQKQRIAEAIEALEVSTQKGDEKAGLQLAFDQAKTGFIQHGINQVILCTDSGLLLDQQDSAGWQPQLGDDLRSRLGLSVFAFGEAPLPLLELARHPQLKARCVAIDSPSQAALRVHELKHGTAVPLAKEVRLLVEFNEDVVKAYRLLGYQPSGLMNFAPHQDPLEKLEIASGQGVTALYEIIPVTAKTLNQPGLLTDRLEPHQLASPPMLNDRHAPSPRWAMTLQVRYKLAEGGGNKTLDTDLKENVRPLVAASREFKFSAAVVGLGMLWQDTTQDHQLTWEQLRRLAQEGLGTDRLGSREEFLQLIDFVAKR